MIRRLAGWAGLVYVVLLVLSAFTYGDAPSLESDLDSIRNYLASDGQAHRVGALLSALAVPFGALFLGGVVASVRTNISDDDQIWAEAARLGAVATLISIFIGDVVLDALYLRNGAELDDSTLRALWDVQFVGYTVAGAGVATLTGAVALAALRQRSWPRWHVGLGFIVAVIGLIAPFALLSASDSTEWLSAFVLPAFAIWSLVSAIVLVRRP